MGVNQIPLRVATTLGQVQLSWRATLPFVTVVVEQGDIVESVVTAAAMRVIRARPHFLAHSAGDTQEMTVEGHSGSSHRRRSLDWSIEVRSYGSNLFEEPSRSGAAAVTARMEPAGRPHFIPGTGSALAPGPGATATSDAAPKHRCAHSASENDLPNPPEEKRGARGPAEINAPRGAVRPQRLMRRPPTRYRRYTAWAGSGWSYG
jgi:hypothetical protein